MKFRALGMLVNFSIRRIKVKQKICFYKENFIKMDFFYEIAFQPLHFFTKSVKIFLYMGNQTLDTLSVMYYFLKEEKIQLTLKIF